MTAEGAGDLGRARLLAARGDARGAAAVLDSILAAEPAHVGALLLRADLLLEARDVELALELNRKAAVAAPRSAETLNGLARCLHAMGRDADALEWARSAHGLLGEGDNFRHAAPVYLTLVWCLRGLRRYREALAAAEEGLALVPDAVLAQWATTVEEELAEAERDRC